MRHKPIEVVIGWKSNFGPNFGWFGNNAAQTWIACPKPKRRLLHVDMGWKAFGTIETAMRRNQLPFNNIEVLSRLSQGSYEKIIGSFTSSSVHFARRNP
jgi:hypothetical protein